MKVNIIYKFLASLILSFFIVSVVYAGNDTSENPVDKTQQFYTKYIQLYFKITPPDAPELKKLMKDNVSPSFLEKIKKAQICADGKDPVCRIEEVSPEDGYVYIIRAQDAYDDWVHVNVDPISLSDRKAVVKVSLGGVQEKAHILSVSLVNINGHWKINSVSDLSPAKYRFQ